MPSKEAAIPGFNNFSPDSNRPMKSDRLIAEFDTGLRTLCAPGKSGRNVPGKNLPPAPSSGRDAIIAARLMRINHSGEVCAQALYQGQALASNNPGIQAALRRSANEERDHLAWTASRLSELGGQRSLLNPLLYASSFLLGYLAGKMGDTRNLGFLAETEKQVEAHLQDQLRRLPEGDRKSRAIVEQMMVEEMGHAHVAERLGAIPLPGLAKSLMRLASGAMKSLTYRF